MLSKEEFEKIESEHGCGYWNLCWENACPCAITTENKGLREDIYNGFIEDNKKITDEYDSMEDVELPKYAKCSECGDWEEEDCMTDGMCSVCFGELQDKMEEESEEEAKSKRKEQIHSMYDNGQTVEEIAENLSGEDCVQSFGNCPEWCGENADCHNCWLKCLQIELEG
ncbi:hypothetical protein [Clostridium beijerinckii]|uniref:hypothetical protein n=1 Tax=Clostridium beijerinckii TaxID=1520 RepID=UPI000809F350|nr:hypothetical protein [Clostridium beijerinckii]OCA97729.1 hypothetical protein BGS1_25400 [Clostridium beijerinckii]